MTLSFRVSVPLLILTITAATTATALAQPQNPPPKHYSAAAVGEMLGGPTLISLKKQNAKPADVLKSVCEQAGIKVSYELEGAVQDRPPLSVNFDKQPFWAVVRSLSADLKQPIAFEDGFQLSDSPTGLSLGLSMHSPLGPASAAGPFLVVVNSISRTTDLASNGQPQGNQRVVAELLVLIDPKLKTRGYPEGRKIELQSETGTALKSVGPDWNWAIDAKSISPLVWRLKAIAELPDSSVRRIAKLSGEFDGFLSTLATEKWQIDQPLSAKEQNKNVGGATFAFRGFEKKGGNAHLLHVGSWGVGETSDFGWPPRSDRDLISSLRLLNEKGDRLPPNSWQIDSGKLAIDFQILPQQGVPTTLVWELAKQVGEIDIPFEFTDLPLP